MAVDPSSSCLPQRAEGSMVPPPPAGQSSTAGDPAATLHGERAESPSAISVHDVTERPVLPPDQYVASLARKRVGATAFIRDEEGRVLIVNPVYKPMWDLPGGAVEADESPRAACRREVAEELGLDRWPGRVLAVDWVPARTFGPEKTLLRDGLIIVFDGGVVSSAELREIVLADGELGGFQFVTDDEAAGWVTPLLARRITACLQACQAGTVVTLENGSPVT